MRYSVLFPLCLAALVVLVAPSVNAKTETPDVKSLIPKAMDLVMTEYPGAIFLEAAGLPADGQLATHAEDIVQWQFSFSTPDSGSILSAVVRYGPPPHEFSPVVGLPLPFTGGRAMPKAPPVTLKGAVKLLRRAGFSGPFEGVVLMNPLVVDSLNPRYLFQLVGPLGGIHEVAVDTVTRDVSLVE